MAAALRNNGNFPRINLHHVFGPDSSDVFVATLYVMYLVISLHKHLALPFDYHAYVKYPAKAAVSF